MSDIYKEALLEAKKLREVAEIDARNRIIEKVSPFVQEMISKEIQSKFVTESVFIEQEEEAPQADLGGEDLDLGSDGLDGETVEAPTTTDPTAGLDALEDVGNVPADAPITAAGENLMNVSVPDEEGMITVDFNDLFVQGDAGQMVATDPMGTEMDITAPQNPETALGGPEGTDPTQGTDMQTQAPEAPAMDAGAVGDDLDLDLDVEETGNPQENILKKFTSKLNEISSKVDQAYYRETVTDITKGALKSQLFSLLEDLDRLSTKGVVSPRQARNNEHRLEFLFLKLKEAGLSNSYNKTSEDNDTMKSLKEFAAQLFEEDENLAKDSQSTGDTGVPTDDEYSAHAADQSGVSPEIGGPTDIKVAQEDKPLSEEMLAGTAGSVDEDALEGSGKPDSSLDGWEEGEALITEPETDANINRSVNENSADANTDANEDVAEGAAGFGDTNEDPAVEFEVDDKEISEAVRAVRKENIRRKMAALREASDGSDVDSWEDGEPEGGEDPSQENLTEQAELMDDEYDDVDVVDDLDVVDDEDMGVDVIDVVDDVDGGEGAGLVVNIDLPSEIEELLGDLDGTEITADVELGSGGEDFGDEDFGDEGDVDAVVLMDDEGEDDEDFDVEMQQESRRYRSIKKRVRLAERRVAKSRRLIESRNRKIAELSSNLNETNLFTAKAVYLNKFLMREGLSRKAMQQIVEHLDRAKTLKEAKTIYMKIKNRLNEHVNASRKLAGSSSNVTRQGSAKLKESVSRTPSKGQINVARWQHLANINPKK